jgi:hypothetical protein
MDRPRRPAHPLISLIVPARDEAAQVEPLYARVAEAMSPCGCRWELLLVDDGSQDGTVERWRSLMRLDPRLGLVVHSRSFGKEAALWSGFALSRGDAVVALDADLQDPPELVARFVAAWRAGASMVFGVRASRADPWWKRATAAAFYRLAATMITPAPPRAAGDFRLIDRRLVDRLLALPEIERCTRALYAWLGGACVGIPYRRPPRTGRRRYGLRASCAQAIACLGHTQAPLWAVAALGLASSAGAMTWFGVAAVLKLSGRLPWAALADAALGLEGALALGAVGIIGLYVGRIATEVARRPTALVDAIEGAARPVGRSTSDQFSDQFSDQPSDRSRADALADAPSYAERGLVAAPLRPGRRLRADDGLRVGVIAPGGRLGDA